MVAVMVASACGRDSALSPSPIPRSALTVSPTQTAGLVTGLEAPYSVGGTIAGLVGTHLVLGYSGSNGGTGSLTIDTNGGFAFLGAATGAIAGTAYNVTIAAQPTTPDQTCRVDGGSGTVTAADVTTISVSCELGVAGPGPTSANCVIPMPGFSGDYRISNKPSATYRIEATGLPGAPVETTTLAFDGTTIVSKTPYQVVATPSGGNRLTWTSTRTEVTLPAGLTIVLEQVVTQALRLPMEPGERQTISGLISGTTATTGPVSCTGTLSGMQQSVYTFVGVEPVTVPAGSFTACRFTFDRNIELHSTCGPAQTSTDNLTMWAVAGVGLVKSLNNADGGATELLTAPLIAPTSLFGKLIR